MFKKPDLLLFHGPSIFDFRKRPVLLGPISDVVPSTPAFEMYPLGLANIAEHLHRRGKSVRIFNLAYRMLQDPAFDAEKAIASFRPRIFGIDLHWLVHAQGAIEVARLCKKHHPGTPVLLGGLSSTYFHEELVGRPEIDFVIRGDSTEESVALLLEALGTPDKLASVPGLTWMDPSGGLKANPMAPPPAVLDLSDDPYLALFRMAVRYLDAKSLTAIHDWWQHPQMAVISTRGCKRSCTFCGGSNHAFKHFFGRERAGYRPPEKVANDVLRLSKYSGAPIFIIGDPQEPGDGYAEELYGRIGTHEVSNEIVVEFFTPPPEEFFDLLSKNLSAYNLQTSPESHDMKVRRACGKVYSNEQVEDSIRFALEKSCRRFDLYFMIGLPEQDRTSVLETVDWTATLMSRHDKRLVPFISALSPFLDPGSPIFENPSKYGYTLNRHSFEDHRLGLEEPSWEFILNYETRWMTRRDIVEVTYEAGRRMNRAKLEHGRVTQHQFERVEKNAVESADLAATVREIMDLEADEERSRRIAALKPRMDAVMNSTLCAKEEFRWPGEGFHLFHIARAVLTGRSRPIS
ncbi:MAG: TIGR04190 family B12-binding domain/radical SAM domain protein [Planctomycetota bacterium]|jgi:B12-binding domain/radical SAM domain protein